MKKALIITGIVLFSFFAICTVSGIIYFVTSGATGYQDKQTQVNTLTDELLSSTGDAYLEDNSYDKECPLNGIEDVMSSGSGRRAYASHELQFGTISRNEYGNSMSPVTTYTDSDVVWDEMQSVLIDNGFSTDIENDESEDYTSQRIDSTTDGINITMKYYEYSGRELDAQISFTIQSQDCFKD